MPPRTKEYMLMPWQGGVVTSIDEALLSQGQLTRGDNLIFDVRGSKKKREGVNEDYDSYEWTNATRSSSGTARTLVGRSQGLALAVGNTVNITTSGLSSYNGVNLTTTAIEVLNVTEPSGSGLVTEATNKINSTGHGFDEAQPIYYTTSGTVIGGLTSGTFYYAKSVGSNDFALALTSGGAAIDLTDDGVGDQVFHSTTITYTVAGTLSESATADATAVLNANVDVIGGHDYWFGDDTRSQYLMTCLSNKKVLYNSDGERTELTDAGTTWSVTPTQASFVTFNDKVFVAVDGASNLPKFWTGDTSDDLEDATNMPEASILQTHIGRMWCNDKTNRDRLHFSETGDHTIWGGVGDSGALDIGVGDGDPVGIVAIFPSFKGVVFVAKRTKLYKISGYTPETFSIQLVSGGIGCVSHGAVAPVDQDDIYFVSDKGVHSVAATDTYGDFSSAYVSVDIQKTINTSWSRSRFPFITAAYVPEINSVAFAVSDNTDSENNDIWFFNIPLKSWYRWADLSCQTMFTASDTDKRRIYLGTNEGRLTKTFNGTNYDVDSNGDQRAITWNIATGLIFVDESPTTIKGFKKLGLIYKPVGPHTITAMVKIDNFSTQSLSFTQVSNGALLGVDFILGQSSLGYDVVLAPYTQEIDGFGRGIKITLEQSGINEQVEIQGLVIVYESAGDQQETRQGDSE